MKYVDHYLTIDMLRERVPDTIWIRAAGIGHKLHVKLTAGPETVLLPGETEGLVQFVYQKPGGEKSDVAMTVNEFRASVVIPRAAVDTVGVVKCEIRVYDSTAGTWWTTPKFTMTVQDVVYDEDAQTVIESDPTVYESIVGSEAGRVSAEAARVLAEQARDAAENGVNGRVAAEAAREAYIDNLKAAVLRGDFNGQDGAQGEKGDTGPQGPKGDKGDKGDKGELAGTGGNVFFGECETAASTAIKDVTVGDDFVKTEGCLLYVWFKYANSATNAPPQLKIGTDAAASICLDATGSSIVSSSMKMWGNNSIVQFTYRNSRWVILPCMRASTNEYGVVKLSNSTSSTSETTAATSKAVKTAYDKAAEADTKATAAAAATTETTGTFTPNFTPGSGNNLTVKQIGHVVYLSGLLVIDGTWGDISNNHLGDISGVDAPAGVPIIQVVSSADMNSYHIGVISAINGGNDTVYVGANVTGTDTAIAINGFYFTA